LKLKCIGCQPIQARTRQIRQGQEVTCSRRDFRILLYFIESGAMWRRSEWNEPGILFFLYGKQSAESDLEGAINLVDILRPGFRGQLVSAPEGLVNVENDIV
jgi:hypothetical protein